MVINEADIREMVSTCLKRVLTEAYPIKPEMEQQIQEISVVCQNEIRRFFSSINRMNTTRVPNGWYNANNDEDFGVWCSKKLDFEGFPPIILKYVHSKFASGAYMEDYNEIWVFFDRRTTAEYIYEVLYHETIHYIDVMHNKMPVVDKSKQPDKIAYDIPRCFSTIFYTLWDKFELRAFAYQYSKFSGLRGAMYEYEALEHYLDVCKGYSENDPIWDELSDIIWGERKNRRNTRNKFITRTEHLLNRYLDLVRRQFSEEEINKYLERPKYNWWADQKYSYY